MTNSEHIILDFLRQCPDSKYSRKEISRKAVRREEYEENQHWADAALAALVARGDITLHDNGLYQMKQGAG
jgi:hypothetical protein